MIVVILKRFLECPAAFKVPFLIADVEPVSYSIIKMDTYNKN